VVVQEIERLLQQFDPQRIWFMDSNFFCNRKRVQEFCERIIDKNIRMEFFGECRYDYFVKYDRSFLQLIKRAGFREIEFGGESGSNRTLAFIKKDITREMILEGVTKCRTEGLRSFTSFMVGFPGETEETREETLDLIDRIQTIDPLGSKVNGLFVFTPFPGTELFDLVVEQHGFVPPDSLEAWGEYDLYNSRNITWFGEKTKRRLQTMSTIQRYFFTFKTLRRWGWKESIRRHRGLGKAMLSLAFNASLYPLARIRWRRRFFDLGFEWRLWHWVFLRFMGRK
jgi:hypothetical protein